MGVIFEYLSQHEILVVIQHLNRSMFYVKVPSFVRIVFLIPFPKLAPKNEFSKIFRTMNGETHKYKRIAFVMNGIEGNLTGEF